MTKGMGPVPDPYGTFLRLTDPDGDSGGPKSYGSYGSGSEILAARSLIFGDPDSLKLNPGLPCFL